MSWRFAWTPKWIVRHVLVIILCFVMINLGFWQLRRLHEKQDRRDAVHVAEALPVAPVTDVIPAGEPGDVAVEAVQYRRATARGTYLDDASVIVDNRTYNGASGGWVLTPLVLDDGTAVVVNRGFIGFDHDGELVPPPAPTGTVEVEGFVLPTQTRGSFGPRDPAGVTLPVLARADLARFAQQLDVPILPAYLQLSSSDPAEPERGADEPELVALDPPETDLGPHFSYAVQWAIFTTIAAGGYVLLLRKVAKEQHDQERLDALEHACERILAAAYACVARLGMAKTTMDDIAREAELSRATLYRAFPGGRDEVLDATVVWEVGRFFHRVGVALGPEELDPAAVLERGLLAARDAFEHHELLQELLRSEADQLLPSLATVMPLVQQALADWYRPQLEALELRPGVDPAMAADLVARMVLSYLGTPGRWDLTDPEQVHRLVEDHLLAAILA